MLMRWHHFLYLELPAEVNGDVKVKKKMIMDDSHIRTVVSCLIIKPNRRFNITKTLEELKLSVC